MRTIFGKLQKISGEYRETVDSLAQDHDLDSRKDFLYSDAVQAERKAERNDRFNALIDEAAQKAVEAAAPEIEKLRERLNEYIVGGTNPATLATLQALLAGGVTLTDVEINSFAQKGGYGVLRLLEQLSGGRIKPPKMESLEGDLKELETFFRDLSAYRGDLASISKSTPWGLASVTGNAIQQGRLEGFQKKLDEMAARWAILER